MWSMWHDVSLKYSSCLAHNDDQQKKRLAANEFSLKLHAFPNSHGNFRVHILVLATTKRTFLAFTKDIVQTKA